MDNNTKNTVRTLLSLLLIWSQNAQMANRDSTSLWDQRETTVEPLDAMFTIKWERRLVAFIMSMVVAWTIRHPAQVV